ncbi:hypothetical protein BELL_0096g00100 [Botrytis elliptica]|uniref:Uncharacterized protein n=1 Tax=Botrytis elliptica TaxID=278938 RepID=A0A4Z1K179_9HELO|nr:hypothetical protein BELL_0096g00100 [Botrytis elliptica]
MLRYINRVRQLFELYGSSAIPLFVFGSRTTWCMQAKVLGELKEGQDRPDNSRATEFKNSTLAECNMATVAAAVVAQIALCFMSAACSVDLIVYSQGKIYVDGSGEVQGNRVPKDGFVIALGMYLGNFGTAEPNNTKFVFALYIIGLVFFGGAYSMAQYFDIEEICSEIDIINGYLTGWSERRRRDQGKNSPPPDPEEGDMENSISKSGSEASSRSKSSIKGKERVGKND